MTSVIFTDPGSTFVLFCEMYTGNFTNWTHTDNFSSQATITKTHLQSLSTTWLRRSIHTTTTSPLKVISCKLSIYQYTILSLLLKLLVFTLNSYFYLNTAKLRSKIKAVKPDHTTNIKAYVD